MLLYIWIPCVIALAPGIMADTLWRAVVVDRNKINDLVAIGTSTAPSLWQCGIVCEANPTCLSWNFENQVCTLSKLMVSPLYQSITTDTVKFYTSMDRDFAVGSTVSAFAVAWSTAYARNLAQGIFNKVFTETCYGPISEDPNPWILFELDATHTIRKIRILTDFQDDNLEKKPLGAEIRIGSAAPSTPGDFSSYKLIGNFPSSLEPGTTYTVESTDGIAGQFVSIQRKISSARSLIFCYVFIG